MELDCESIDQSVRDALVNWELPAKVTLRLINISENRTYLIEGSCGYRSILRLHRSGYHTRLAIESELAWMQALQRQGSIITPTIVAGRDGQTIQALLPGKQASPRYLVMFEYLEGVEPQFGENHEVMFETLGAMAACMHLHAIAWQRPTEFQRLVWDLDAVFGDKPTWGDWRDAPGMSDKAQACLEQVQVVVVQRLLAYGSTADRFGLIHGDMRLANLLIHEEETRLIDFDDCGIGWYLFDFAAAISFMEDHSQVPRLLKAWLCGYRRHRALDEEQVAVIPTLVMLRRLSLCAWMGTHPEVDVVQQLRADFVSNTLRLGETYLREQRG
ncbi:phosphotransferase enzyme family protein [Granulosicoccus antarcticus]|uniref:Stress response kinase A n=1 Tax=Granulosicoccus antarcticus IMCC3135 TaxID=1192854 RepID=A0A2Z2NL11_9GAMM|nr:phosphotransferase [Granulosicoccus antarcticus]ASJ71833.1 Stress response kinase A [Granulosicoccus antarcticus IMCC3135]